ncbi:MAG: hypothetical protein LAO09_17780, partial [Acidobacteriia bacterium]|nr:hypothetical protein [Terriglobia bacterium]
AQQVAIGPPTFAIRVNLPEQIHFSYERYLINSLRHAHGFAGSPLRLSFVAVEPSHATGERIGGAVLERLSGPRRGEAGQHISATNRARYRICVRQRSPSGSRLMENAWSRACKKLVRNWTWPRAKWFWTSLPCAGSIRVRSEKWKNWRG